MLRNPIACLRQTRFEDSKEYQSHAHKEGYFPFGLPRIQRAVFLPQSTSLSRSVRIFELVARSLCKAGQDAREGWEGESALLSSLQQLPVCLRPSISGPQSKQHNSGAHNLGAELSLFRDTGSRKLTVKLLRNKEEISCGHIFGPVKPFSCTGSPEAHKRFPLLPFRPLRSWFLSTSQLCDLHHMATCVCGHISAGSPIRFLGSRKMLNLCCTLGPASNSFVVCDHR